MIWGYRSGLPLTWTPDGQSIPRHSWEILDSAPGIVLFLNQDDQPADPSALSPGDLVFFDAKATPGGSRIDHVGMYLGTDSGGHQRFISSRQHENGPTLGDAGGASILDGNGIYARAFRAARRL
jgi:cell wall-associated NlpC family hydrolase